MSAKLSAHYQYSDGRYETGYVTRNSQGLVCFVSEQSSHKDSQISKGVFQIAGGLPAGDLVIGDQRVSSAVEAEMIEAAVAAGWTAKRAVTAAR